MNLERESLEAPKNEVHLEWPAEFDAEEIKILEEAAGIYNAMHNLDQYGMGDTKEILALDSDETLKKATEICEKKGYGNLATLITKVQEEAEEKYQAVA